MLQNITWMEKRLGSVEIKFQEGTKKAGYSDYLDKVWKQFWRGKQVG